MLDPVCLTNIFKKCLKDEVTKRHRKDSVGGAAFRDTNFMIIGWYSVGLLTSTHSGPMVWVVGMRSECGARSPPITSYHPHRDPSNITFVSLRVWAGYE